MSALLDRPFERLLAEYQPERWTDPLTSGQNTACPIHPEKVRKESFVDACDAMIERLKAPRTYVKRFYKCPGCNGWHFTSHSYEQAPENPFPRPYLYGVVVEGSRIWQHDQQAEAERFARRVRGQMVPFLPKRGKNPPPERCIPNTYLTYKSLC